MKKIILILAGVALVVGCASNSKNNNEGEVNKTKGDNVHSSIHPHHGEHNHALASNDYKEPLPAGSYLEFPKDVEPGQCFAQVTVPAKYEYRPKKVMVTPEFQVVKTRPPQYQMVDKKIVIQEGAEKITVVPAKYKTVKERVLVSPERKVLKTIPAAYKSVQERVLMSPARKVWKVGKEWKKHSLQTKTESNGEIRCLVHEPAVYKTITKKVVSRKATTTEVMLPAKYKVIDKVVMETPARTLKTSVPAVTKTVKVKEMVKGPSSYKQRMPAVYKEIKDKVLVRQPFQIWTKILCQTNDDRAVVSRLQTKLKKLGFYNAKIDGVVGPGTHRAVELYQRKVQNKPYYNGRITYDTLKNLNVI